MIDRVLSLRLYYYMYVVSSDWEKNDKTYSKCFINYITDLGLNGTLIYNSLS